MCVNLFCFCFVLVVLNDLLYFFFPGMKAWLGRRMFGTKALVQALIRLGSKLPTVGDVAEAGKRPWLIEGYCTQRSKWPTSLSSGSASHFLLWAFWMQSGLFNCKPDRWSRYVFPWMGMKGGPHVPMTQWWQLLLISRDGASRWGVVWMLCIRTGWWVFWKSLNRAHFFLNFGPTYFHPFPLGGRGGCFFLKDIAMQATVTFEIKRRRASIRECKCLIDATLARMQHTIPFDEDHSIRKSRHAQNLTLPSKCCDVYTNFLVNSHHSISMGV